MRSTNVRSVTNDASKNDAPTAAPPVLRKSHVGIVSDSRPPPARLPPCALAVPVAASQPSPHTTSATVRRLPDVIVGSWAFALV